MTGLPWSTALVGLATPMADEGLLARALEGIAKLVVPARVSIGFALAPIGEDRPLSSILREAIEAVPFPVERLPASADMAAARNAVLDLAARERAQIVGLLDDSLAPDPRFLKDALAVMAQYDVPVVVGRARPRERADWPRWTARSPLLARDEPELSFGGHGEARLLVLDREAVEAAGVRFAPKFARAGLSGRAFLAELERREAPILHCGAATAECAVPQERLTLRGEARALARERAFAVALEARGRGLLATLWRRLLPALGASLCGLAARPAAGLFGDRGRIAARRLAGAFPATLAGLTGLLPRRAEELAEE
ncbi:MAG: hypothetical protein H6923_03405 [Alphaproteobacteria bacterium]|nr:hypothetical protein [Alphaproteobacteria bacterium]